MVKLLNVGVNMGTTLLSKATACRPVLLLWISFDADFSSSTARVVLRAASIPFPNP